MAASDLESRARRFAEDRTGKVAGFFIFSEVTCTESSHPRGDGRCLFATAVRIPPIFITAMSFCTFRVTICATSASPCRASRKASSAPGRRIISNSRKVWSSSHAGSCLDYHQRRDRHGPAARMLAHFPCPHHRAVFLLGQNQVPTNRSEYSWVGRSG